MNTVEINYSKELSRVDITTIIDRDYQGRFLVEHPELDNFIGDTQEAEGYIEDQLESGWAIEEFTVSLLVETEVEAEINRTASVEVRNSEHSLDNSEFVIYHGNLELDRVDTEYDLEEKIKELMEEDEDLEADDIYVRKEVHYDVAFTVDAEKDTTVDIYCPKITTYLPGNLFLKQLDLAKNLDTAQLIKLVTELQAELNERVVNQPILFGSEASSPQEPVDVTRLTF